MKILVTGGAGFIGSNFIDYILHNTSHDIINVDVLTYAGTSTVDSTFKDRYTFYKVDIGSYAIENILKRHKPDYIINFAAETHVDKSIGNPAAFVKTNVLSTYNFIQSVQNYFEKNNSVRFVHVSTDEVYGQLSSTDPAFTENTPYAPNSPYSATKASGDHLVRAFHHTYGLPAIITNCSNNYGPRQYPEKLIPVIIKQALNNKKIPIYGNGMNVRDWLYVKDHCEALYLVLTKGTIGDKYNIGGNAERTNLTVVLSILYLLNKSESLIEYVEDRKGHDYRYAIDSSHIEQILGWSPTVSFEEGLRKTVDWYTNNMEWVKQCEH
jgi:dTDP-glucose 4,6-dehydratase